MQIFLFLSLTHSLFLAHSVANLTQDFFFFFLQHFSIMSIEESIAVAAVVVAVASLSSGRNKKKRKKKNKNKKNKKKRKRKKKKKITWKLRTFNISHSAPFHHYHHHINQIIVTAKREWQKAREKEGEREWEREYRKQEGGSHASKLLSTLFCASFAWKKWRHSHSHHGPVNISPLPSLSPSPSLLWSLKKEFNSSSSSYFSSLEKNHFT